MTPLRDRLVNDAIYVTGSADLCVRLSVVDGVQSKVIQALIDVHRSVIPEVWFRVYWSPYVMILDDVRDISTRKRSRWGA
jgi:hypothetical protein